ncbi:MAG: hypothetical protein WCX74_00090 [Candidatus Paceibacterota bacterium]
MQFIEKVTLVIGIVGLSISFVELVVGLPAALLSVLILPVISLMAIFFNKIGKLEKEKDTPLVSLWACVAVPILLVLISPVSCSMILGVLSLFCIGESFFNAGYEWWYPNPY